MFAEVAKLSLSDTISFIIRIKVVLKKKYFSPRNNVKFSDTFTESFLLLKAWNLQVSLNQIALLFFYKSVSSWVITNCSWMMTISPMPCLEVSLKFIFDTIFWKILWLFGKKKKKRKRKRYSICLYLDARMQIFNNAFTNKNDFKNV